MYLFLILLFSFYNNAHAMNPSQNKSDFEHLQQYVLKEAKLSASPDLPSTHTTLKAFFSQKNINDYTDAAKFGRENSFFDNPDDFNTKLGKFFKANDSDIIPQDQKRYQALILGTSGIDGFIERLAFLSRLTKSHTVQTEEVIALVGTHAHREDLKNIDYLLDLPSLFSTDFDLTTFDKEQARKSIEPLVAKKAWIHTDGMETAWQLTDCDPIMKQLKNKFRYFSGDCAESLRTEQLIERLIAIGLRKTITKENPIAFVCSAQGAAKTKEMINKYFADKQDSVDILVARPVADEIEEKLFNDTPQQRAMTKLFHFYRILETVVNNKK